ncbi:MAG: dienelactone hydrolase family protein [Proteobacteria bacterium]|nr:dienelactone hydrolase family protein [Pseudomonadota bacterium]
MSEEIIKINSDDNIILEGLYDPGTKKHGVIITHPHPLYGGDMYNNVVEAIQSAYQKKGYATLRFNFRGVGASGGTYDDGIGEQKDIIAGYKFLKTMDVEQIDLCGYSFGTWVNAQIKDQITVNSSIMVSPPVAMMKFETDLKINHLILAVTGSEDGFAPPELVEKFVSNLNGTADIKVIDGADHFFLGYEDKLAEIVDSYIADRQLGK